MHGFYGLLLGLMSLVGSIEQAVKTISNSWNWLKVGSQNITHTSIMDA